MKFTERQKTGLMTKFKNITRIMKYQPHIAGYGYEDKGNTIYIDLNCSISTESIKKIMIKKFPNHVMRVREYDSEHIRVYGQTEQVLRSTK